MISDVIGNNGNYVKLCEDYVKIMCENYVKLCAYIYKEQHFVKLCG